MLKIDFTESRNEILERLESRNENWVLEIVVFLKEWWNEKTSIAAYTSGSTGNPKEIIIDKRKAVNSALATGEFFNFEEGNTALLCMSPKFIAGKLMIVRAVVWKMNLVCVEPTSSPLKAISSELNLNFAAMVPLQLQNSLAYLKDCKLDNLIVGGGAVEKSLSEQLQGLNTNIYSSYGMTETITHVALKRLNGKFKNENYKALNNVKFETDDRNCLVIDAPKLSEELVVTNDIVKIKSDTEFEWIGRYDNIINSGGVKINPEKIEELLSEYISSPFFIASISDSVLGEKVVLIIEGKPFEIDLEMIKSMLPKYHNPKDIFFVDEFILTESGKVNRSQTLGRCDTDG